MKKIGVLSIFAFWMGVTLFILGQLIDFYPGAETEWFAASAVLCLFGFLIRGKAYRIGALFLVIISIAISISGYRRGEKYRDWLSKKEEQIRQLREQRNP